MKLEELKPQEISGGLVQRLEELRRILKRTQKKLGSLPLGQLKISQKDGLAEFYHIRERGSSQGTYIPAGKKDFAAGLAQKAYDVKLVKLLEREIKAVENYLRQTADGKAVQKLYENLSSVRQSLVVPVTLPDEQYAVRWKQAVLQTVLQEEGRIFSETSLQYYTANGERVRSKSEVIIADALLRHGVPYCYEAPLKLKHGSGGRQAGFRGTGETGAGSEGEMGISKRHTTELTFYPDFLCLNLRTRGEFYWEHFGKMDDEDYKSNAVGKLNLYAENSFFPGRNLIMTMESNGEPLDTRVVERMINEFLL